MSANLCEHCCVFVTNVCDELSGINQRAYVCTYRERVMRVMSDESDETPCRVHRQLNQCTIMSHLHNSNLCAVCGEEKSETTGRSILLLVNYNSNHSISPSHGYYAIWLDFDLRWNMKATRNVGVEGMILARAILPLSEI